MMSSTLGDFFLTVMPRRLTRSGRIGWARLTRFCTRTWAMLRSVPSLKVIVSVYEPSLVHCDDMYIMPSTPLTCCSIGAATVSATTCALAPGYEAETSTVGGAISGYCASGSVKRAMVPPSTITIDSTDAKIGRLMKKLENNSRPLFRRTPAVRPGVSAGFTVPVAERASPPPARRPGFAIGGRDRRACPGRATRGQADQVRHQAEQAQRQHADHRS